MPPESASPGDVRVAPGATAEAGPASARTESASRVRIIAAARGLVESGGLEALSMRKVAAEVGLAPTAIYWHIGSREDLLHAVLDRMVADLPQIEARGTEARTRIESVVRAARREYLDGMRALQLANEIGRGNEMSFRAQLALARELTAAGLVGHEAASVLRSLLFLVGGFVMIEEQYRQSDPAAVGTQRLWAELDEPDVAPGLRAAMAGPTDTEALFEFTLARLLDAVL